MNHNRYAIGIDQKENASGRFLIATPEKALVDLIHQKSKKLKGADLLADLIEARRIDEDILKSLDKKLLLEIGENYRSETVTNLINVLGLL